MPSTKAQEREDACQLLRNALQVRHFPCNTALALSARSRADAAPPASLTHWASEIDFVIWTGDNARHDNDRKNPRTPTEIYDLNRAVAAKMERAFTRKGIPVVPSLGNNDVWPHNIMEAGPNSITNTFSLIWKSFIPFPAYQVFQRGGYYHVEVIPNSLAVVSLNTMYFYDSNKAVGGCQYLDRDDPGNLQFDWLEVQLTMFRERNMQVWLSGHVPPSPGNYFPECYVRYAELALRFQDTILGHLFGHMNADHFTFVEAIDLQFTEPASANGKKKKTQLYKDLIDEYSAIPTKKSALNFDDYGVINVSPPVVPNPYLPTFRVFSYNITGYKAGMEADFQRKHKHRRGDHRSKDKLCKKEPFKNSWKCRLSAPWHSDPESPSRLNRLWTPLGYAQCLTDVGLGQYYLPHLERANKTKKPKFKLEYLTYPLSMLHPKGGAEDDGAFQYPVPVGHLPRSVRNGTVEGESKPDGTIVD
ncbi:hypothetical protein HGRIS_010027 [Hohenbuehelia grisea]|uniref:Endopolyphosphatase n=1 Tax=Hohenbuehelia grisea TaxID=104357 RepID=A0ABR3J331_9AGAR